MIAFLSRLLNIRSAEWPRLLFLYAMLFLTNTGTIWAIATVESVFLKQIGLRFLPWIIVINAVLSIPAMAVYTAFADRVRNTSLYIAINVLSVIGIAAGIALMAAGQTNLAFALLYLIIYVLMTDLFGTHWFTYVNGFYDTRSAKRVIPVLGTASRIAGIVAGLTIPLLHQFTTDTGIVALWGATLVVAAILAWLMPRLLDDVDTQHLENSATESYLGNLHEGYRYVISSRFLRWLGVATLLLIMLLTLAQYMTAAILIDQFASAREIADFLGKWVARTNLIMLPIQLFFLNRIIGRIGLGNASLIFPVTTFTISGLLVILQNKLAAGLAFFNRSVLKFSVHGSIDALLYNAVPIAMKGRARAFIAGMLVPVGTIVAGLILVTPIVTIPLALSLGIALLATAYLVAAIFVRREYTTALMQLLDSGDYDSFLAPESSELAAVDAAALQDLADKLEQSDSAEFTRFMAQLIAEVAGRDAVPILAQAAHSADSQTRAALLDILATSGQYTNETRQVFVDFLGDADPAVRSAALIGLSQVDDSADSTYLDYVLPLLNDPDLAVRSEVIPLLLKANNTTHSPQARAALDTLLADSDPEIRARGVHILATVGSENAIRELLSYTTDLADAVRLEAALGIDKLLPDRLPKKLYARVITAVEPLETDPIERNRIAAIDILHTIGTASTYPSLIAALKDDSPAVRHAAVDAAASVGSAIIPLVHRQLNAPKVQQRKMAAIVLCRIDRSEYEGVIRVFITDDLLHIYSNHVTERGLTTVQNKRGVALLRQFLHDETTVLLENIFYLLTAIHDENGVRQIQKSLQSYDTRAHANGLETLETLTTPKIAGLIAPFCRPKQDESEILGIAQSTWQMQTLDLQATFANLLRSNDKWTRMLTTHALGDMGAEKASGGRRRRSRNRPNPLAMLNETPSTPATTQLTQDQVTQLLDIVANDPEADVLEVVATTRHRLSGQPRDEQEHHMLSTIERMIFLKEVPFFAGMNTDQLKVVASVCEEVRFSAETRIYSEDDAGGEMYVVVDGRVAIERGGARRGSVIRLETLNAHGSFGEMNLFDDSPRSASARVMRDALVLRLRREPLIALARQYPDLSLQLINVLSARLRETTDQVARLTKSRPRELHKLFDTFEEEPSS